MKNILMFTLILIVNHAICQFPSTTSYKLCYEIPKAEKIGDTVYVYTCMKSGDGYVLQNIDRKGRYKYKRLSGGKLLIWASYDSFDKVQSYTYRYSGFGGSGKGFFLIKYYENGNIDSYLIDGNRFYSAIEIYKYDSLSYKEPKLSKISFERYYLYKKGKRYYIFEKDELERKIIRKTIRNSHFEKVNLIGNSPYDIFQKTE